MSSTNLDHKIQKAYADLMRKEKIVIHIEHLDQTIIEEESRLKVLDKVLEEEEKDYLKFDKTGVRNLFLKALGTHHDQLDKEKQEYLLAYIKYNECVNSIERLYQEKELLMKTLFGLFDAQERLDQLLLQKRNSFSAKPDSKMIEVFNLEKKLAAKWARTKEIEEAIRAGEATKPLLLKIIEDLKHIKDWGIMSYAGKGRYSSYKKKKYIDQATKEVFEVNVLFEKFELELQDIAQHFKLNYKKDIALFKQFVDMFLKNLVNDWVTKKKIHDAITGVSKTQEQVFKTIATLKKEITKTNQEIQKDQLLIKEHLVQMTQNKKS